MSDKKDTSAGTTPKSVQWNDTSMQTSYANVCNVSSTREEMTLLFGTNQTWHAGQPSVTVDLSNRIVLNPYAAKRLSLLLAATISKYEETFGEIQITSSSGKTVQ